MSTDSGTNSRDRFRFTDEAEVADFDAALREAATDADSVDVCADAAAEALGDADRGRLRIRAFQLGLYEPEWPSHVTREDVESVATDVDTLSEAAEELRLSRKRAKKALRWAGVIDEVEQMTTRTIMQKVRNGDLDGTIGGATSGGPD